MEKTISPELLSLEKELPAPLFLWILSSPPMDWNNLCELAHLCDLSANKTDTIASLLWPEDYNYGEFYWQWRDQCWTFFNECWEEMEEEDNQLFVLGFSLIDIPYSLCHNTYS